MRSSRRWRCLGAGLAAALLLATGAGSACAKESGGGPPRIGHLFTIVLENHDASATFGPSSPAPYLARTLRRRGAFVPGYYGTGHRSLPNYLALISGQPANPATSADCTTFSPLAIASLPPRGVAIGQGCVYPRAVQTIAGQLERRGLRWRAYMEDLARARAPVGPGGCPHPTIGGPDPDTSARPDGQYATRHDPFVYFRSVTASRDCGEHVVDLGRLRADLRNESATPTYSFISPDLCADGHDAICADGRSPGGYAGIEAFLRLWVPRIEASAAYRDHGAILITFDESDEDASSCCEQRPGPNFGSLATAAEFGGGRVGAIVLSPCTAPGTISRRHYNHYAALAWAEDNFGLPRLAYARSGGLRGFGRDVFNRPSCARTTAALG